MSNSFERRQSLRYSIALKMQFTIREHGIAMSSGMGKIRNVRGAGIFFESTAILSPGSTVRLIVDWPVRFRGAARIDWIVDAVVVRSTADGTAVKIMKHRFERRSRTREKKLAG